MIGAIIGSFGYYEDKSSLFVGNRKVEGGGGYYFINSAKTYFCNTLFVWNYASIQGGAIALTQQSIAYIQNVTFIECSSDKGGVLFSSEESLYLIINSTFKNNFANTGGILHGLENYHSTITIISSNFFNNSCEENLFNLMDSNLIIKNTNFSNNSNILFGPLRTTLFLDSVSISSHKCNGYAFGCIMNAQNSLLKAENLKIFESQNYFQEGIMYLEDSVIESKKITFQSINNNKHIGSCFDIKNTQLFVDEGNFSLYDSNCIYAINSSIYLNNSLFDNEQFVKVSHDIYLHGSIYCYLCYNFAVFNSIFKNNTLSENAGGIALVSQNVNILSALLINVRFLSNEVYNLGGAIRLVNVNAKIEDCFFFNNKAKEGAAILFYSSSNTVFFKKLILNLRLLFEFPEFKWESF